MKQMELHPEKVLIQPDEEATMSKGGIHIPDNAFSKEKPMFGTVRAYGAGKITSEGKQIPVNVMFPSMAEGARVMFGAFGGQPLEMDGVKYLMLRLDDLYGVMTEVEVHTSANGRKGKGNG